MRRRGMLGGSNAGLTLSSTGSTASIASGYTYVTVYYNNVALSASNVTVSSSASWCTPTWQSSNKRVRLARTLNDTLNSSRVATITITYNGQSVTYRLSQSSASYISLYCSSTNVDCGPHTATFYVRLNGQYDLSGYTGVTITSSSGILSGASKSTTYISASITTNVSLSQSRSGSISVSYQGSTSSSSVYQDYGSELSLSSYSDNYDSQSHSWYLYVRIDGYNINNLTSIASLTVNGALTDYYYMYANSIRFSINSNTDTANTRSGTAYISLLGQTLTYSMTQDADYFVQDTSSYTDSYNITQETVDFTPMQYYSILSDGRYFWNVSTNKSTWPAIVFNITQTKDKYRTTTYYHYYNSGNKVEYSSSTSLVQSGITETFNSPTVVISNSSQSGAFTYTKNGTTYTVTYYCEDIPHYAEDNIRIYNDYKSIDGMTGMAE